jgi:MFS family permease
MQNDDLLDRKKLFWIGVLALFTAAMSFSMRAAVAVDIKSAIIDGIDIARSATLLAEALGVAFLGFAITLFAVSPLLDLIGIGRVIRGSALAFLVGTLLVIFASVLGEGESAFRYLWLGMLLKGVGWGATEAAINPMTTSLYPEDKTHRLNVLHAWWPAGLIVGGLLGVFTKEAGVNWQISLGLVIIPAIAVLVLSINTVFPSTEREANGVSMGDMLREVIKRPSFFIWFAAMFLTAASELAPGQWIDFALTEKVGFRGILLLIYVAGLMFVMRHFAGPLSHRLSNTGLLWFSSLFAAAGLYLLSIADGAVSALIGATVWGIGVCFMWPTMLASVAERYPRGGSWLIGLLGSAGALSIYFVLPKLGALYDTAKIELAGGQAQLATLSTEALREIENMAASESFATVALVPVVLLVFFAVLWFSERGKVFNSLAENDAKQGSE